MKFSLYSSESTENERTRERPNERQSTTMSGSAIAWELFLWFSYRLTRLRFWTNSTAKTPTKTTANQTTTAIIKNNNNNINNQDDNIKLLDFSNSKILKTSNLTKTTTTKLTADEYGTTKIIPNTIITITTTKITTSDYNNCYEQQNSSLHHHQHQHHQTSSQLTNDKNNILSCFTRFSPIYFIILPTSIAIFTAFYIFKNQHHHHHNTAINDATTDELFDHTNHRND